jgi:hypothetical protein
VGFVGGLKVISPTESRTVGVTQRRNKELIGDLENFLGSVSFWLKWSLIRFLFEVNYNVGIVD